MHKKTYDKKYNGFMKKTVKELKHECKLYQIKHSGNKIDIIVRLYQYKLQLKSVILIQKIVRGYLVRKYFKYKGKSNDFVNNEDFLSFDDWKVIPYHQRFVYQDENNLSYAFDSVSLYTLYLKHPNYERKCVDVLNPYTRKPFPHILKEQLQQMIRIGSILGFNIQTSYETSNNTHLTIKNRIDNIFIEFERIGHHTCSSWFSQLTKYQIIRYIRELSDIWNYRANLTQDVKKNIIPPSGNPFKKYNFHIFRTLDYSILIEISVDITEQFVFKGVNDESKSLGSLYILTALTLVSQDAASSLPWLYESVSQH